MYSKQLQETVSKFIELCSTEITTRFWNYFNLNLIFSTVVFSFSILALLGVQEYLDPYLFENGIIATLVQPGFPTEWISVFMWNSISLVAAFIAGAYCRNNSTDNAPLWTFLFGKNNIYFLLVLSLNTLVQLMIFNGNTFGITAWINQEESPFYFYAANVVAEILHTFFDLLLALFFFSIISGKGIDTFKQKKFLLSGILILLLSGLFFGYAKTLVDSIALGFLYLSDKAEIVVLAYMVIFNLVVYTLVLLAHVSLFRALLWREG